MKDGAVKHQHDFSVRLRMDCEGRALSLMEMSDWLTWLSDQLPDDEAVKIRQIAFYVLDSAGVLHALGTDKAHAGALLQGHVLAPPQAQSEG